MRTLVIISLFLAAASAQFFPGYPFPGNFPAEDMYAASLGGAPVGLYDKKHLTSPFGGSSSDVTSASLGGAKVGVYGKEHPQQYPGYFPYAAPVIRPYPLRKPVRPVYPLPKPYYRSPNYWIRN